VKWTNQVRLAQELDEKFRGEENEPSIKAMHELAKAAGTTSVGIDGRLLIARRARRYRLGVKSSQLAEWSPGQSRVVQGRFERLDEERVAHKLLNNQRKGVRGGVYLEW
jgi:hypothetical protein